MQKKFSCPGSRLFALMFCLVFGVCALAPDGRAEPVDAGRFRLDLEGGAVWQTTNDVQIPNSSEGTRFSLVDLTDEGPQPAWRVYLTWHFNEKHSLRALYAPLEFNEQGTPEEPLLFAGGAFAAGEAAEATYKFNSYRLTYAYRLHAGESWTWRLGFTGKVRDARVQLVQGDRSAKKDDVGFVPLLHLNARRALGADWDLEFDVDALAGGPGRAIDGSVQLGRRLGEGARLSLGYRTVEGGADVDEVYSFAWLHYAVAALSISR